MEVLFFALPLDHAHKDLHKDSTVLRGTGSSLRSSPTPDGAVLRGTGILAQKLSFSQTVPSRKEQALRSEALPLDHTVDDAVFQFPGQKKLRLPVCRLDRRLLYSLRLSRRH